jgi:hypothetical protein
MMQKNRRRQNFACVKACVKACVQVSPTGDSCAQLLHSFYISNFKKIWDKI